MELYIDAITHGVDDLVILEKQKEYGPIIIDINLKISCENKRLYNEKLILNIAKKYIDTIKLYLDISKDKLKFVLLEKNYADKKDQLYKDGFHIMFPSISTNEKIRHLIRYKVVEMCNNDNTFDGYLNNADDIIDKAVVSSNSWFLYGSKKPGSQTYKLTKIFNNELNIVYDHIKEEFYNNSGEIINNGYYYDDETIINYLSIRNKKNITKLNNQYTESDIEDLINNQCKELDKNFKNQKDKYIIELDNQCIELDNQCIELYNQCIKLNEKCIKNRFLHLVEFEKPRRIAEKYIKHKSFNIKKHLLL